MSSKTREEIIKYAMIRGLTREEAEKRLDEFLSKTPVDSNPQETERLKRLVTKDQ